MALMNGGEAVVAALRAAGVDHVFGLLGSSTMEMYDALYDCGEIRYIGVRDERAGTHMADAFGRIAGRPAVVLAGQAGPGAANLTTGLAQALLAYSPVVAITGLASSEHLGRGAFQEIDQQALFAPIAKRTITVPKAERLPEFVKEAVRLANSGRRGPVVLNIPRDMFAAQIEAEVQKAEDYAVATEGTLNPAALARVARLVEGAASPVIMAGAGVKWGRGSAAVLRLAEALELPVTASAGHADVIPNDHPMFAGMIGPRGNEAASRLTREADLVLALGTRLGFNTTFYTNDHLNAAAKIVQVDISPDAIGRYFPVAEGIIGDAGAVADALAEQVHPPDPLPWSERNATFRAERAALLAEREAAGASELTPLAPGRVFAELRQALPRDAIVTLDAGTMCLQATDQLQYFAPPALLSPLDFGLVGFSYAAGIGAKCAAPERPVVTLMGDGGFAMTMAEIATAVQSAIPTVAVVLDNGCWGAEKAYQRDFYNGRYIGADIVGPDYDKVAELCGAKGWHVTEPGGLADALSEALAAGKPGVIHVKVDPNAMISFRRDSFKHRAAQ